MQCQWGSGWEFKYCKMIAKNNDKITRAIKKGNKNNDLFYNAKKQDEKEGGATDGRKFQ